MSGHSTYLSTQILNWVNGTTMPAAPSGRYVALFNGDPTDSGAGGTEVTTTIRGAGRVGATFGAISAKSMSNSALVDFGNAAGTATVTHFGIFDAASGGNMLGSNALSSGSGSITSGTATNFAIGALTWGE